MIIDNILLNYLSSNMENVKALIKKCLDENSKELIIRDTNLTSLPSEIGALTNLHTLKINNNPKIKHPYDKSDFYLKTIPAIRIIQAKAKLRYLRRTKAIGIIISHIRDWLWRPYGHMFERTKQHFFNSSR